MSAAVVLIAESRDGSGTGPARAIRREGKVPSIVYGGKKEKPQKISVDLKELWKQIEEPGFLNRLYKVSLNGKEQAVLAKQIQLHPVTDEPLHVDFIRVQPEDRVSLKIPLSFVNADQCPGIKQGGRLNVVRRVLDVSCLVSNIPEVLEIDLTGKMAGDSIRLDDLTLPSGAKAIYPKRDQTLGTVMSGRGSKSMDESLDEIEDAESSDGASEDNTGAKEDAEEKKS